MFKFVDLVEYCVELGRFRDEFTWWVVVEFFYRQRIFIFLLIEESFFQVNVHDELLTEE